MGSHIHVVLTEDLANVGKSGELVKVRPGFARNYLIPRGLAMSATKDNVALIEHQKKVAEAKAHKAQKEAGDLATRLSAVKLTVHRQVGEGEKLYGSVTSRDIEEALAAQGFVVDRRRIMSEPLKALGVHKVSIRLATNVHADIEVEVAAKP
jgi:large subunit ribosomal protein L9